MWILFPGEWVGSRRKFTNKRRNRSKIVLRKDESRRSVWDQAEKSAPPLLGSVTLGSFILPLLALVVSSA